MEYLVQQPKALETMTINTLRDWILSQGKRISLMQNTTKTEDLLNRQIKIIKDYLRKLPSIYINELAVALSRTIYKFLRSDEFECSDMIRRPIDRMIETIYSENLTCLTLRTFHSSHSKSYNLTGIVDLTFGWSYYETEDTIHLLKELHMLRYLDLSNCRGISRIDDLLSCIADNCKLIEVIDLCFLKINDSNIHILTRLKNLKSVDLRVTDVSEIGVETLLMSCENIENIAVEVSNIECALENIASFDENAAKQFKLTSYWNFPETTLEQLQLIANMCPLIQKMFLTKYDETQNSLMALADMQHLRKLKLHKYRFNEDQVLEFLKVRGYHLTHLHLKDIAQVDLKALMYVSQMCPNLESLILKDCDYENHHTLALGDERFQYKDPASKPLFRNLKRISLTRLSEVSKPSDEQLFFLLSNCPNVEFISTSRVPLRDALMLRILDRNPLIHLKELILHHQDRPAVLVIDKIIQNCINLSKVTLSCTDF